ncbi:MAG: Gfo/Idh/MocA family oxidoreductase [Chloroflexota bacterium]
MSIQKEERLLRIGVLGCGPIAQAAHFDACLKARNVELYAICDRADDLRQRMTEIYQPVANYADYDTMLADENVEAVIVATADQFHVPLCQRAIAAGKHVFVEKPLGVTIEECEALRTQVAATNLVFQVGNNKRYDPGIAFAHKFVQDEIGDLMAFKGWYCDSVHRYTMTDNLQPLIETSAQSIKPQSDLKADRGRYVLMAHGVHLVDTAQFLAGEIVAVQAQRVERFGAYCWFVSLEFANGAVGHLDLTIAIRGDWDEGFRIYGEYGSVKANVFLPWFHKASEVECYSVRDNQYHRPLGADGYTYRRQLEGFAETILQGKPTQAATLDDGLTALRALVAISRSAETNEPIRLADVSGGV